MTIDIEKLKGEAKYQREKALRAAVKLGHNMTTFSTFKLAFTPAAGLVRDTYHNEAACKLCGGTVRVAWSEADGWSSVPITLTCLDLVKGPAPLPPEAQTGFVAEIAKTAAAEYHGTQPPTPPAVEISGAWTPTDPQQALGRGARQPQLKIGDIVAVHWLHDKSVSVANPSVMIAEDLGDSWKTHQGSLLDKRTLIFHGNVFYAVPLTTSCEASGALVDRTPSSPRERLCPDCGVTLEIGVDQRIPQHSRPIDYNNLPSRERGWCEGRDAVHKARLYNSGASSLKIPRPSGMNADYLEGWDAAVAYCLAPIGSPVEVLNRTPDPIEEPVAKKTKITPRRQMTEAEKKARKRRNKAAAQARRRNR